MAKILNLNTFLLILLLATSYVAIGIGGCGGSGGGGNGKNKVKIDGLVQEVIGSNGQVSDIRVSVFENNKRKKSDRTNQSGAFNLKFKPNDLSAFVTLEFEGPDYTLSRVITVTRGSTINLNVIIDVDFPDITFTNWTVDQRRLKLSSFDQITYDESEAVFRIDGNGNDCIKARGESRAEIAAQSISLIDCKEGISTQSFALIDLQADEDINVVANKDAIRSKDNSSVALGMTASATDNNIFITSNKENGIRASGSSLVIVDPQFDCIITGAKQPINQSGTSTVNPDGCTLVGGN